MQPVNQSETPEITIKIRSLDKEFSVKIQAIEKIEELKRKIQVVSILLFLSLLLLSGLRCPNQ